MRRLLTWRRRRRDPEFSAWCDTLAALARVHRAQTRLAVIQARKALS